MICDSGPSMELFTTMDGASINAELPERCLFVFPLPQIFRKGNHERSQRNTPRAKLSARSPRCFPVNPSFSPFNPATLPFSELTFHKLPPYLIIAMLSRSRIRLAHVLRKNLSSAPSASG